MLKEIIDLAKFGKELIESKNAKVKGWRKFYQLYCKLDDVIDASVTAVERYLPAQLDAHWLVSTTSFDSPIAKWVYFTNDDFRKLDKAVKEFLGCFRDIEQIIEIYDGELHHKLFVHFWAKSVWCERFVDMFCSGELSPDGKKIRHSALRLADRLADQFDHSFVSTDNDVELLAVREEYDISEDKARMSLVEMGRANIVALKHIKSDLGVYIKHNCKIEDLL